MHVLMISLDKTLLGEGTLGDAEERHRIYGERIGRLSIVVFTRRGFKEKVLSPRVHVYPTNSFLRIFSFLGAYRIGKSVGRRQQVSLIDAQDPLLTGLAGYMLKKALRSPLEVHYHGDFWNTPFSLRSPFENKYFIWLASFISKRAEGIRVVSTGIKDKLRKMGIAQERIRVIPTPVHIGKFLHYNQRNGEEIRKRYPGWKIVLFVGRFEAVKNLPMLLRIAERMRKEIKDVLFLCIGSGNLLPWFREEIRRRDLGDTVIVPGGIPSEELPMYYAASDVVILTSWSESFGKVLVEAAVSGKPTVSTATTGAKDIIKNGDTGYLAPINDTDSFMNYLKKILNDSAIRVEFGARAREFVRMRFDRSVVMNKIIQFWMDIAKNSYKT